MAEIRPPLWPVLQPQTPAATRGDARIAAQKAFFAAALAGQTAAPAPQASASARQPASSAPAQNARPTQSTEPVADNIPRPGSIVDIWV